MGIKSVVDSRSQYVLALIVLIMERHNKNDSFVPKLSHFELRNESGLRKMKFASTLAPE